MTVRTFSARLGTALAATAALLAASLLSAPVGSASPGSVDHVMSVIAKQVAAGKWGLVEANIGQLEKTIRQEISVNHRDVVISSNPIKDRLAEVTERGRILAAERSALRRAITAVEALEGRATLATTISIFEEMYRELKLISPEPSLLDVNEARDTSTAEQIVNNFQQLTNLKAKKKYLKDILDSLDPALQEVKADRAHLVRLDRKLDAVLAKYQGKGLTIGVVAPPATSTVTGSTTVSINTIRWSLAGVGTCTPTVLASYPGCNAVVYGGTTVVLTADLSTMWPGKPEAQRGWVTQGAYLQIDGATPREQGDLFVDKYLDAPASAQVAQSTVTLSATIAAGSSGQGVVKMRAGAGMTTAAVFGAGVGEANTVVLGLVVLPGSGSSAGPAPAPAPSPTPKPSATAKPSGTPRELLRIWSTSAVSGSPTAPSCLTLTAPTMVTSIMTYHWLGKGAPTGTIGLTSSEGTTFGPWPAVGTSGSGVKNAQWTVEPNVVLPAGTYCIADSNPATWGWTGDTGGRGMSVISGVAAS